MNHDQIMTMKRSGMFIGLHGYNHYWLGSLSEQEMKADFSKALEVMQDFIEPDKWVMNYPYGDYSDEIIKHISGLGCAACFTTEVRVADTDKDNRYKIPRLDCNDFPPKSDKYREID